MVLGAAGARHLCVHEPDDGQFGVLGAELGNQVHVDTDLGVPDADDDADVVALRVRDRDGLGGGFGEQVNALLPVGLASEIQFRRTERRAPRIVIAAAVQHVNAGLGAALDAAPEMQFHAPIEVRVVERIAGDQDRMQLFPDGELERRVPSLERRVTQTRLGLGPPTEDGGQVQVGQVQESESHGGGSLTDLRARSWVASGPAAASWHRERLTVS